MSDDERRKKLQAGRDKLAAYQRKKAKKNMPESEDGLIGSKYLTQFRPSTDIGSKRSRDLSPSDVEKTLEVTRDHETSKAPFVISNDNQAHLHELETKLSDRDDTINRLQMDLESLRDSQAGMEIGFSEQSQELSLQITMLQTQLKQASSTLAKQAAYCEMTSSALRDAKTHIVSLNQSMKDKEEALHLLANRYTEQQQAMISLRQQIQDGAQNLQNGHSNDGPQHNRYDQMNSVPIQDFDLAQECLHAAEVDSSFSDSAALRMPHCNPNRDELETLKAANQSQCQVIETLKAQNEEFHDQLGQWSQCYNDLRDQYEALYTASQTVHGQLETAHNELNQLRSRNPSLEASLDERESALLEVKISKSEKAELSGELENSRSEAEKLRIHCEELNESLNELQRQLEGDRCERIKLEEKMENQAEDHSVVDGQLETSLSELGKLRQSSSELIVRLKCSLADKERLLRTQQNELSQLRGELENSREPFTEEMTFQRDKMTELLSLMDEKDEERRQLHESVHKLSSEITDQESEFSQLRLTSDENKELRSKISQLEHQMSQRNTSDSDVIAEKEREMKCLHDDIEDYKEQLENLGLEFDRLNQLLAESQEEKCCLENDLEKYVTDLNSSKDGLDMATSEKNDAEKRFKELKVKLEQKENEMSELFGTLDRERLESVRLRQQNEELRKLENENQALRSDFFEMDTMLESASKEKRQLNYEIEKLQERIREKDENLEALHSDYIRMKSELHGLKTSPETTSESLRERLSEVETELLRNKSEFETQLKEGQDIASAWYNEATRLGEVLSEKDAQILELESQISSHLRKDAFGQSREELCETLVKKESQLAEELDEKTRLLELLEEKNEAIRVFDASRTLPPETELQRLRDAISEKDEVIAKLSVDIVRSGSSEPEHERMSQELAETRMEVSEGRAQVNHLVQSLDAQETQLAALKQELETKHSELENLHRVQECLERSQLDLHETKGKLATQEEQVAGLNTALNERDRQIEELLNRSDEHLPVQEASLHPHIQQIEDVSLVAEFCQAQSASSPSSLTHHDPAARNELLAAQNATDDFKLRISDLESEIASLNDQLAARESRISMYQDQANSHLQTTRELETTKDQLTGWVDENGRLKTYLTELETRCRDMSEQMQLAYNAVTLKDGELDTLMAENHQKLEEIQRLENKLRDARITVEKTVISLHNLKEENSCYKSQIDDMGAARQELQQELEKRSADLDEYSTNLETAKDENHDLIEKLQKEKRELEETNLEDKARIADLEKVIDSMTQKLYQKETEILRTQENLEKLERNIPDCQPQENSELLDKITELTEMLENQEKEILYLKDHCSTSVQRIDDLDSCLEERKMEVETLTQQVSERDQTLVQWTEYAHGLTSAVQSYEANVQYYQSEMAKLNELLSESKAENEEIERRHSEVEKRSSNEVTVELNEELQTAHADLHLKSVKIDDLTQKINELEDLNSTLANAESINSDLVSQIDDLVKLVSRKESDIAKLTRFVERLEEQPSEMSSESQKLELETVHNEKAELENVNKELDSRIMKLELETEDLKQKLESTNQELSELTNSDDSSNARVRELTAEIETLREDRSRFFSQQDEVENLKAELKSREAATESIRGELEKVNTTLNEQSVRITELEAHSEGLRVALAERDSALSDWTEYVAGLNTSNQSLENNCALQQSQINDLNGTLTEKESQVEKLREEMETIESELRHKLEEVETLQRKCHELEASIGQSSELAQRLFQAELETKSSELEKALELVKKLESELVSEKEETEVKMSELQRAVEYSRESVSKKDEVVEWTHYSEGLIERESKEKFEDVFIRATKLTEELIQKNDEIQSLSEEIIKLKKENVKSKFELVTRGNEERDSPLLIDVETLKSELTFSHDQSIELESKLREKESELMEVRQLLVERDETLVQWTEYVQGLNQAITIYQENTQSYQEEITKSNELLLERDNRIIQMETLTENLQQQIEELKPKSDESLSLKERLNSKLEEIERLNERFEELEKNLNELEESKEIILSDRNKLEGALLRKDREMQEMENRLSTVMKKENESRQMAGEQLNLRFLLDESNLDRSRMAEEMEVRRREERLLRAEIDKYQEEMESLEMRMEEKTQLLVQAHLHIDCRDAEISGIQENLNRKREEINDFKRNIVVLETDVFNKEEIIENLHRKKSEIEERLDADLDLEKVKLSLEEKCVECEALRQVVHDGLSTHDDKVTELENELNMLQKALLEKDTALAEWVTYGQGRDQQLSETLTRLQQLTDQNADLLDALDAAKDAKSPEEVESTEQLHGSLAGGESSNTKADRPEASSEDPRFEELLGELQTEIRKSKHEKEQLEDDVTTLEARVQKYQSDLEAKEFILKEWMKYGQGRDQQLAECLAHLHDAPHVIHSHELHTTSLVEEAVVETSSVVKDAEGGNGVTSDTVESRSQLETLTNSSHSGLQFSQSEKSERIKKINKIKKKMRRKSKEKQEDTENLAVVSEKTEYMPKNVSENDFAEVAEPVVHAADIPPETAELPQETVEQATAPHPVAQEFVTEQEEASPNQIGETNRLYEILARVQEDLDSKVKLLELVTSVKNGLMTEVHELKHDLDQSCQTNQALDLESKKLRVELEKVEITLGRLELESESKDVALQEWVTYGKGRDVQLATCLQQIQDFNLQEEAKIANSKLEEDHLANEVARLIQLNSEKDNMVLNALNEIEELKRKLKANGTDGSVSKGDIESESYVVIDGEILKLKAELAALRTALLEREHAISHLEDMAAQNSQISAELQQTLNEKSELFVSIRQEMESSSHEIRFGDLSDLVSCVKSLKLTLRDRLRENERLATLNEEYQLEFVANRALLFSGRVEETTLEQQSSHIHEIASLRSDLGRLRTEKENYCRELQIRVDQLDCLRNELREQSQELDAALAECDARSREVENQHECIHILTQTRDDLSDYLSNQVENFTREIVTLESRSNRMENELARVSNEKKDDIAELEREKQELIVRVQNLEEEVEKLQCEKDNLEVENFERDQDLMTLQEEVDEERGFGGREIDAACIERSNSAPPSVNYTPTLSRMTSPLPFSDVETDIRYLPQLWRQLTNTKLDVISLTEQLEHAKQNLPELSHKLDKKTEELHASKEVIKALTKQSALYRSEVERTNKELHHNKTKIDCLLLENRNLKLQRRDLIQKRSNDAVSEQERNHDVTAAVSQQERSYDVTAAVSQQERSYDDVTTNRMSDTCLPARELYTDTVKFGNNLVVELEHLRREKETLNEEVTEKFALYLSQNVVAHAQLQLLESDYEDTLKNLNSLQKMTEKVEKEQNELVSEIEGLEFEKNIVINVLKHEVEKMATHRMLIGNLGGEVERLKQVEMKHETESERMLDILAEQITETVIANASLSFVESENSILGESRGEPGRGELVVDNQPDGLLVVVCEQLRRYKDIVNQQQRLVDDLICEKELLASQLTCLNTDEERYASEIRQEITQQRAEVDRLTSSLALVGGSESESLGQYMDQLGRFSDRLDPSSFENSPLSSPLKCHRRRLEPESDFTKVLQGLRDERNAWRRMTENLETKLLNFTRISEIQDDKLREKNTEIERLSQLWEQQTNVTNPDESAIAHSQMLNESLKSEKDWLEVELGAASDSFCTLKNDIDRLVHELHTVNELSADSLLKLAEKEAYIESLQSENAQSVIAMKKNFVDMETELAELRGKVAASENVESEVCDRAEVEVIMSRPTLEARSLDTTVPGPTFGAGSPNTALEPVDLEYCNALSTEPTDSALPEVVLMNVETIAIEPTVVATPDEEFRSASLFDSAPGDSSPTVNSSSLEKLMKMEMTIETFQTEMRNLNAQLQAVSAERHELAQKLELAESENDVLLDHMETDIRNLTAKLDQSRTERDILETKFESFKNTGIEEGLDPDYSAAREIQQLRKKLGNVEEDLEALEEVRKDETEGLIEKLKLAEDHEEILRAEVEQLQERLSLSNRPGGEHDHALTADTPTADTPTADTPTADPHTKNPLTASQETSELRYELELVGVAPRTSDEKTSNLEAFQHETRELVNKDTDIWSCDNDFAGEVVFLSEKIQELEETVVELRERNSELESKMASSDDTVDSDHGWEVEDVFGADSEILLSEIEILKKEKSEMEKKIRVLEEEIDVLKTCDCARTQAVDEDAGDGWDLNDFGQTSRQDPPLASRDWPPISEAAGVNMAELLKRVKHAEEEAVQLREYLARAEAIVDERTVENDELFDKVEIAEKRISFLETEKGSLEKKYNQLIDEYEESKEKLATAECHEKAYLQTCDKLEEDHITQTIQLNLYEEQVSGLRSHAGDLRQICSLNENNLSELEGENEGLKQTIDELESRLEHLRNENKLLGRRREEMLEICDEYKIQKDQWETEKVSLREERNHFKTQNSELSVRICDLEESRKLLLEENFALRTELEKRVEITVRAGATMELEKQVETTTSAGRITYHEAQVADPSESSDLGGRGNLDEPLLSDDEPEQDVSDTRRSEEKLSEQNSNGSTHLRLVEENDGLKKRVEELTAQNDDLQSELHSYVGCGQEQFQDLKHLRQELMDISLVLQCETHQRQTLEKENQNLSWVVQELELLKEAFEQRRRSPCLEDGEIERMDTFITALSDDIDKLKANAAQRLGDLMEQHAEELRQLTENFNQASTNMRTSCDHEKRNLILARESELLELKGEFEMIITRLKHKIDLLENDRRALLFSNEQLSTQKCEILDDLIYCKNELERLKMRYNADLKALETEYRSREHSTERDLTARASEEFLLQTEELKKNLEEYKQELSSLQTIHRKMLKATETLTNENCCLYDNEAKLKEIIVRNEVEISNLKSLIVDFENDPRGFLFRENLTSSDSQEMGVQFPEVVELTHHLLQTIVEDAEDDVIDDVTKRNSACNVVTKQTSVEYDLTATKEARFVEEKEKEEPERNVNETVTVAMVTEVETSLEGRLLLGDGILEEPMMNMSTDSEYGALDDGWDQMGDHHDVPLTSDDDDDLPVFTTDISRLIAEIETLKADLSEAVQARNALAKELIKLESEKEEIKEKLNRYENRNSINPEHKLSDQDLDKYEEIDHLKRQIRENDKGMQQKIDDVKFQIKDQHSMQIASLERDLQFRIDEARRGAETELDLKLKAKMKVMEKDYEVKFIQELQNARCELDREKMEMLEMQRKKYQEGMCQTMEMEISVEEVLKQLHSDNQDLREANDSLLMEIDRSGGREEELQEQVQSLLSFTNPPLLEAAPLLFISQSGNAVPSQPQSPILGKELEFPGILDVSEMASDYDGDAYIKEDSPRDQTKKKVKELESQCHKLCEDRNQLKSDLAALRKDHQIEKEEHESLVCNLEGEMEKLRHENSRLMAKLGMKEIHFTAHKSPEASIATLSEGPLSSDDDDVADTQLYPQRSVVLENAIERLEKALTSTPQGEGHCQIQAYIDQLDSPTTNTTYETARSSLSERPDSSCPFYSLEPCGDVTMGEGPETKIKLGVEKLRSQCRTYTDKEREIEELLSQTSSTINSPRVTPQPELLSESASEYKSKLDCVQWLEKERERLLARNRRLEEEVDRLVDINDRYRLRHREILEKCVDIRLQPIPENSDPGSDLRGVVDWLSRKTHQHDIRQESFEQQLENLKRGSIVPSALQGLALGSERMRRVQSNTDLLTPRNLSYHPPTNRSVPDLTRVSSAEFSHQVGDRDRVFYQLRAQRSKSVGDEEGACLVTSRDTNSPESQNADEISLQRDIDNQIRIIQKQKRELLLRNADINLPLDNEREISLLQEMTGENQRRERERLRQKLLEKELLELELQREKVRLEEKRRDRERIEELVREHHILEEHNKSLQSQLSMSRDQVGDWVDSLETTDISFSLNESNQGTSSRQFIDSSPDYEVDRSPDYDADTSIDSKKLEAEIKHVRTIQRLQEQLSRDEVSNENARSSGRRSRESPR